MVVGALIMSGSFQRFVRRSAAQGKLVVQPRMGFGRVDDMQAGLLAVASLPCQVIGTITLDSYTRVGDYLSPLHVLARGEPLNGFPIVSHDVEAIRGMLANWTGESFPIQVRHGTARPQQVFHRLAELGLVATEGGPVSYCMPYGREPLRSAVNAWAESCRILAGASEYAHIESFGGCLLGQLCPPSLLLAVSLLEALFFQRHGIGSVSLSYAQGTSPSQDRGALRALRLLAGEYLQDCDWHVVIYTYMGVFPATEAGAMQLIADSAHLARQTACERLIVKTVAESRQIPSLEDNLQALQLSARHAATAEPVTDDAASDAYFEEILEETRALLEATFNLHDDVGEALILAFRDGVLDIPFCLHADNAGLTRTFIDSAGALRWANQGKMPIRPSGPGLNDDWQAPSEQLYQMLHYMLNKYDCPSRAQ